MLGVGVGAGESVGAYDNVGIFPVGLLVNEGKLLGDGEGSGESVGIRTTGAVAVATVGPPVGVFGLTG
jgi:hypothetical protein